MLICAFTVLSLSRRQTIKFVKSFLFVLIDDFSDLVGLSRPSCRLRIFGPWLSRERRLIYKWKRRWIGWCVLFSWGFRSRSPILWSRRLSQVGTYGVSVVWSSYLFNAIAFSTVCAHSQFILPATEVDLENTRNRLCRFFFCVKKT
jgi:hypothetical protein